MRILLLPRTLCCCACFAAGASVDGREFPPGDPAALEKAEGTARQTGAMVALLFTREREPDGDLIAFLKDPRVERALGSCVPLRIVTPDEPALAARFKPRRLPAVVFVDGEGREAGRIGGLLDPVAFGERTVEIFAAALAPRCSPSGRLTEEAGGPREAEDPSLLAACADRARRRGEEREAEALFERADRALRPSLDVAASATAVEADRRREAWLRARLALGEQRRRTGELREAERHFSAAIAAWREAGDEARERLEPEAVRAALGLALARRAAGRAAEAKSVLEAALDRDAARGPEKERARRPAAGSPARERALYALGVILLELDEEEEARERFALCAAEFPSGQLGERARRRLEANAAR